jgi:gliding motility-associated-like protein
MWEMYSFGKKRINVLLILIFCSIKLFAQTTFVNTNPFPQHFFIENKGQFNSNSEFSSAPEFELNDKACDIQIFKTGFSCKAGGNQISQIFRNTNPKANILTEGKTQHYFSYGLAKLNAFGYASVIIQNLYPNIDLRYEVHPEIASGFKYSFILKKGSNISDISWEITGDDSSIWSSPAKATIISKHLIINQTDWKVYDETGTPVSLRFIHEHDTVKLLIQSYRLYEAYNIDPWVHTITNMDTLKYTKYPFYRNSGINADFDEAGNVYVYGGCGLENSGLSGKNNLFRLAKYNNNGALKWIFQGKIDSLNWYSNSNWFGAGNFLVTPGKHKIYITQDFNEINGNKLIRLDSNGNYDNFIRPLKSKKLDFSYRNGFRVDKLLCDCIDNSYSAFGTDAYSSYGGYGTEELILKFSDTGIQRFSHPEKWQWPENQHQINNATQDPSGNRFVLFGRNKTRTNANSYIIETSLIKISKGLDSSIWSHTFLDSFLAGYANRLISGRIYTNWGDEAKYNNGNKITVRYYPLWSMNATASDKNYVFVYEGKNLYSFHATIGKLITIDSNICDTQRQQSGIAVDYSNHVFVGGDSSNIKVFSFDGKKFTPQPEIVLISKSRRRIQDVKYDINSNTLIVTGDSLIAKISNPYTSIDSTLLFYSNGPTTCDDYLFVTLPRCDSASKYSFVWTDNKTQQIVKQVDSLNHFSDTLFNPTAGQQYTVKIQRNFHCKGAFTHYQLRSNPKQFITQSLQFCAADTWIHSGFSHHRDTTFTDSLKNQFGCDSLIQYKLTFKPRSFTFLNPKICRGDSFSIGARAYRISGSYTDTFTNFRGCDSIVNTSLTVLTDTSLSIKTAICLGDTIRFNNLPFFATGSYQIKTIRSNGCDSVINLQLTVNPPKFVPQQLSLCNTDSFSYRNKKYPLPLSLRDTLSAFTGCDSVFELSVISHKIKSDFSIDSTQFPTLKFISKTTNAKQWIWDFGDLNSSNIQSPNHSYIKSFQWINYKVCLVVRDSFGCDDTLCFNLPIKPEAEIQIPEGISPNGDGINDTLVIPGLWAFPKATWVIFNRWGQVVFESNAQQNIAWDGKNQASGQKQNNEPTDLLPEGVYFIVFNYNDGHRPTLTKNIYLKR